MFLYVEKLMKNTTLLEKRKIIIRYELMIKVYQIKNANMLLLISKNWLN